MQKYKVLTPKEAFNDSNADWSYEINGTKSKRGYISKKGAYNAMIREVLKRMDKGEEFDNNN